MSWILICWHLKVKAFPTPIPESAYAYTILEMVIGMGVCSFQKRSCPGFRNGFIFMKSGVSPENGMEAGCIQELGNALNDMTDIPYNRIFPDEKPFSEVTFNSVSTAKKEGLPSQTLFWGCTVV